MPLIYDELRTLARSKLRGERPDHTLGTTGLVHEAYLRLRNERKIAVADRSGFFAVASTTMRRILVDYARARARKKRDGGRPRVSLEDAEPFLTVTEADELLALNDALARLADRLPRVVQVVEHRFFRRPQPGRDRRHPGRVVEDRSARLGGGPRLAAQGGSAAAPCRRPARRARHDRRTDGAR